MTDSSHKRIQVLEDLVEELCYDLYQAVMPLGTARTEEQVTEILSEVRKVCPKALRKVDKWVKESAE